MARTGPPSADRDTFSFLAYTWDVTAAAELARPLPVRQMNIVGLTSLMHMIRVDEQHARTVDLSVPILAVTIPEGPFVVDGWHRISRALALGYSVLPGRLLPVEQEFAVRLYGGTKGPRPSRVRRGGGAA